MASLIPGYEYDIFISYRQKDNKYDGWVTEFVNNLRKELEATFKEEISVYLDINPQDGLLETHDVDASLKKKLKCLVFIPVISRTYCDPKSFAWEHEFKAFIEQAAKDQYGMKVNLPDGNVASRVLPVRIHELDSNDLLLCESALGGYLRGIEFIYKEPGVNRPLTAYDNEKTNINKTIYRNQINRVANAIRDVVSGLKEEPLKIPTKIEPIASPAEKPPAKEKSIIVLPFENISNDPEQEYFSDGLTEEIITDLSHIQDILVISRNSAMAYKGARKKTAEIAGEVNVNFILEGSVRKAGERLRITAQLINAAEGYLVWSEKFDRSMGDIFDIQDELTAAIVDRLKVKMKASEKAVIEKHYTKDPEAYTLYLKGMYFSSRPSPESLETALGFYRLALEKDPGYALPYVGIANIYGAYGVLSLLPPQEVIPRAKEALHKALQLDENLAEVYATSALTAFWFDWDWKTAEYSFRKALSLNPGMSTCRSHFAWYELAMGRFDEAITQIIKAQETDPLMPLFYAFGTGIYHTAGKNDEGLEQFKKAIELEPDMGLAYFHAGRAYGAKGMINEAILAFQRSLELVVYSGWAESYLGTIFHAQGNTEKAENILSELIKQKNEKWVSSVCIAFLAGELNKFDLAFEYFDKAFEERDTLMPFINIFKEYKKLRADPRFQVLLTKLNLDDY
ncbi:MAG: hypothetical protein K0B05_08870 [Bacteroidales bacterium]|nr:hypothetical protein [Bacteroidales bacterium]